MQAAHLLASPVGWREWGVLKEEKHGSKEVQIEQKRAKHLIGL